MGDEAGAGPLHKKRVVDADYSDTLRTTIYTGRPCRVFKTPYNMEFEEKRQADKQEMESYGIPAFIKDCDPNDFVGQGMGVGLLQLAEVRTQEEKEKGIILSALERRQRGCYLTGQCAGAITDIKPAATIVQEMVSEAAEQLRVANTFLTAK